jgi:hypothetical protein
MTGMKNATIQRPAVAFIFFIILLIAYELEAHSFSKEKAKSATCLNSYKSCNLGEEDFINLHIVSHTHDDVG